MVGSPVLSVRLGGIYALKRLADEHPEQYHIQVMELYCAFVRNPTGGEKDRENQDAQTDPYQSAPPLREDVQVVLTAIGGRSKAGLDIEKARKEFRLELRHADLRRAHLPGAYLAQSDLGGADMRGAYFCDANLSGAYLQGAKLHRANLISANLSGARVLSASLCRVIAQGADFSASTFGGTDLSDAELRWANLSGANISISNLSNAKLEDANLSGAMFGKGTRTTRSDPPVSESVFARLTQQQLDEACADPDNPPKIAEGTVDIESGEPLIWRGKPCARDAR